MKKLFYKVPECKIVWEGLEDYNDGLQRVTEFEVTLRWIGPAFVEIAGILLSPDDVEALHQHLVSATLGQMSQGATPGHPFEVSTVVLVNLIEESPLPSHRVEEVIEWLSYVLGYQAWDPADEEWSY